MATAITSAAHRMLEERCSIIGCGAPVDEGAPHVCVSGDQLEAMLDLHLRHGSHVRAASGGKAVMRFCERHASPAVMLLGEHVAEVPSSTGAEPYRIGRVERLVVDSDDVLAVQPFFERYGADAVQYGVRFYPPVTSDGRTLGSVPWFEDESPAESDISQTFSHAEVRRGIAVYEGLNAYVETCAPARLRRSEDSRARIDRKLAEVRARARWQTALIGHRLIDFFSRYRGTWQARAGILISRAIVVVLTASCLFATYLAMVTRGLHARATISAAVMSVLATSISMFEIISHLQNVHSPELQLYVVRILFVVPVFSIDCWFSLRFANNPNELTIYINVARDVYEAFVIHTFFLFLTACFGEGGGGSRLAAVLASKPAQHHHFGLGLCLPMPRMGTPFLLLCKYATLQFVAVKTLLTAVEVVLHATGHYQEGDLSPRSGYLWLSLGINCSQMVALYGLLLFYHALAEDLAPIRPLGKFMSVKLIIFFTFWQSIAIAIAVHAGLIKDTEHWQVKHISTALNSYLLCAEMLIAAVLHRTVFSHRDFIGGQIVQETRRPRRFDSMVFEAINPKSIVVDTGNMLCAFATCTCCDAAVMHSRRATMVRLPTTVHELELEDRTAGAHPSGADVEEAAAVAPAEGWHDAPSGGGGAAAASAQRGPIFSSFRNLLLRASGAADGAPHLGDEIDDADRRLTALPSGATCSRFVSVAAAPPDAEDADRAAASRASAPAAAQSGTASSSSMMH